MEILRKVVIKLRKQKEINKNPFPCTVCFFCFFYLDVSLCFISMRTITLACIKEKKECNIINRKRLRKSRRRRRRDGQWEKSAKTSRLCTDPCLLRKREGKKVGGVERRREKKQAGRWGRKHKSARPGKKKLKGRKRRWRRAGIKKESADDVIMQLTPPAPAQGWGCVNKPSGRRLLYSNTHSCLHTAKLLESSPLRNYLEWVQNMPQKVNLHICSLSVDRAPDILRPAWHEGQTAGDFDCSARFSLGEHQTEGKKKHRL